MHTNRFFCRQAGVGITVAGWLTAVCMSTATADNQMGFVAGSQRPAGDGTAIEVPGGWMVAYKQTIPGTDVTFSMIPVPGGIFSQGSPAQEADRSARLAFSSGLRIVPSGCEDRGPLLGAASVGLAGLAAQS